MYSKDLVERAIAYREAGHTFAEIEKVFCMTRPTYHRCKKQFEDGYYDRERPPIEHKRKIDKQTLRQVMKETPDLFLHELAALFGCKTSSMHAMLAKLKITRKKNVLPIPRNRRKSVPPS